MESVNRMVGTVSRGVRAPIIREGDNLAEIVVDCVLKAAESEKFEIRDKDVIAVTEAVVARAQGNYASVDAIAADVKEKFGDDTVGVLFPILSRNRFSICLKGIAKGCKKIVLMLSYPSDEVGNHLIDLDIMDEKGVNPWSDVLTEEKYRELFGYEKHVFTGVDYVEYYKQLIQEAGAEVEIIFANNPKAILSYTKSVLTCDIHTRQRTKRILSANGAEKVYALDDIMNHSINGSGYNDAYGLLGSNKATEDTVKLFPIKCDEVVSAIHTAMVEKTGKNVEVMIYGDGAFKDPVGNTEDTVKLFPIKCDEVVSAIHTAMVEKTGKNVEVMIYGDGAFKDPVGKIWELADPVVSPAYTKGLEGTPNEVKLKYLADNDFADLSGEELKEAIKEYITEKDEKAASLKGTMVTQGTTPRRLTDLLGSLADLTSGSGDKGTPIIYIQGYFDNYAK